MQEELLQKATLLKEESERTEQELAFITQNIEEIEELKKGLDYLQKNEEEEILASLGKGIYIKLKKATSSDLFVQVGAGTMVKKTPEETIKTIEEQLIKLKEAKIQLLNQLEEYSSQFKEMLQQVRELKGHHTGT